MPILNYTTTVSAEKTIAEIQKNLAKHGANAILQEYDADGSVASVSFKIVVQGREMAYRLPTSWERVQVVLKEQKRRNPRVQFHKEQAQRVAWRIIKDWVEAQMAIIEAQQATIDQIMLPYAITAYGKTIYEQISDDGYRLIDLTLVRGEGDYGA